MLFILDFSKYEKSHAFFPFQSEYGIGKDHVNFSRALVQEFHDDFYQENLADQSYLLVFSTDMSRKWEEDGALYRDGQRDGSLVE